MEQTFDLNCMGLEPMTEKEKANTDGGWVQWALLGVGIVLAGVVADWPDFKKGLNDGLHGF